MEENKINMPPPPKELRNMPPPPPKFGTGNGTQVQPAPPQKTESVKEEKNVSATVAENTPNTQKQAENVVISQVDVKSEDVNVEEKKKPEKVKHKPVGGIRTFLYWLGFAVSLVAVGVAIYLLVK